MYACTHSMAERRERTLNICVRNVVYLYVHIRVLRTTIRNNSIRLLYYKYTYGTAQMQRRTRSRARCSNLDYSQHLSLEVHTQNLRESRHKSLEISTASSDRAFTVGSSHLLESNNRSSA